METTVHPKHELNSNIVVIRQHVNNPSEATCIFYFESAFNLYTLTDFNHLTTEQNKQNTSCIPSLYLLFKGWGIRM